LHGVQAGDARSSTRSSPDGGVGHVHVHLRHLGAAGGAQVDVRAERDVRLAARVVSLEGLLGRERRRPYQVSNKKGKNMENIEK